MTLRAAFRKSDVKRAMDVFVALGVDPESLVIDVTREGARVRVGADVAEPETTEPTPMDLRRARKHG